MWGYRDEVDQSRLESLHAHLEAVGEIVERQRERLASLTEPWQGTPYDDIVTALHEAERQLLLANRGVQRAAKIVDRTRISGS